MECLARPARRAPSLERHRAGHQRGAERGSGAPGSGSAWSRTATGGSTKRSRPPGSASTSTSWSIPPWPGSRSPIPLSSGPRSMRLGVPAGRGALRGRPVRGGRGRRAAAGMPAVLLVPPVHAAAGGVRDRRLARASWPTTCSRRDSPHDRCALVRAPDRHGRSAARSGCSSPSPASTATTAAPRWSPRRSATPGWRSSTPGCTRRPR